MAPVGEQVLEVLGAILILAAYGLAQFRGLNRLGWPFLLMNAAGAAVLGAIAAVHGQWGFLLVQAVWTVVALMGLWPLLRGRVATRT
ncbi:MAG: hypothetical protein KC442_03100 [Thermomicrobiales bacterium]|nr:hypothetical protein [Thermomicrobiales bacterium]